MAEFGLSDERKRLIGTFKPRIVVEDKPKQPLPPILTGLKLFSLRFALAGLSFIAANTADLAPRSSAYLGVSCNREDDKTTILVSSAPIADALKRKRISLVIFGPDRSTHTSYPSFNDDTRKSGLEELQLDLSEMRFSLPEDSGIIIEVREGYAKTKKYRRHRLLDTVTISSKYCMSAPAN